MNTTLLRRTRNLVRALEIAGWAAVFGFLLWLNAGCNHAARIDGDFEVTLHLWDVGISVKADDAVSEAEIDEPGDEIDSTE